LIGPVELVDTSKTGSPDLISYTQKDAMPQTSLLVPKRLISKNPEPPEAGITPKPDDHRFVAPAWQQYPYNLLTQAVLLGEEWWDSVAQSPNGVGRPNARIVAFTVRQWLDLMSPSNVPWLNPEVIEVTRATDGANLAAGMRNLMREWNAWLERHSGQRVDPQPMGASGFVPLCDAPGTYVLER
jgi:Poly-beta-hydroxybutyrate polymerase (PhaC) N-terminus